MPLVFQEKLTFNIILFGEIKKQFAQNGEGSNPTEMQDWKTRLAIVKK